MKNGFYKELDQLRKDTPDADFGFLENLSVSANLNALQCLHGFCDEFAAMLSDLFGYQIECLRHWEEDDFGGKLIHAYCVAEIQGETAYIDVRGITTDAALFFSEFENEVTFYPEDYEFWDLEGPATVEHWPDKDSLFDGDYEGWSDDNIRSFIMLYRDYYDADLLMKKGSLDNQIKAAARRSAEPRNMFRDIETCGQLLPR